MAGSTEGMVPLTAAEQDGAGGEPSAVSTPDADDLVITENSDAGIYEAALGGQTVAGLVYRRAGNRVTLLATSVFPEHRGKGIAARLLGGVLDKLRAQDETVTVTCPFAAAFINAHAEYRDMLDPAMSEDRMTKRRGHGR